VCAIGGWLSSVLPARAAAEEAEHAPPARERPDDPIPTPTLPWAATQLVPSPELVDVRGSLRAGVRWQVTPVLYSFGVNRHVTPWRFLIVEPNVRQSGSIESFVSPEVLLLRRRRRELDFGVRSGMRTYFPLLERGATLSCSIGAATTYFDRRAAVAYEAGIYGLYGIIGLQVAYAPSGLPANTMFTLRLRYF
jgi:hypothetical protein